MSNRRSMAIFGHEDMILNGIPKLDLLLRQDSMVHSFDSSKGHYSR